MRRSPRLVFVLPAALVLAVASPLLRTLPGGMALPDPLLLLLFLIVPRYGSALRPTAGWVFVFGLLRASVSAASPWVSWAGYGLGLAARSLGQRFVAEERFLARFLLGIFAALPLAVLDQVEAARLMAPLGAGQAMARVLWVGLVWAVALAPPTARQELAT